MNGSVDYATFSSDLRQTPLFRDLSKRDITAFLEALKPPLRTETPKPGTTPGKFHLVVRCKPYRAPQHPRWLYDMPGPGEVGMLMGELAALSRKDLFVRPFHHPSRGSVPKIKWQIETLEFSVDTLTADYGPDIARIQLIVLRNLAGMVAQKASDIRRDYYLQTIGVDMYGQEYLVENAEDNMS